MAYLDRILQVQLLNKLRKIVGVGIHIIAMPGLGRASVASSVQRDASIAIRGQEEHLVLKGICRQRPSMTENDRLACAPIFVVNLRSIFRRNSAHLLSLAFWCLTPGRFVFGGCGGFCPYSFAFE